MSASFRGYCPLCEEWSMSSGPDRRRLQCSACHKVWSADEHDFGTFVPCAVCEKPTVYGATKRCNNCWEVERRLPEYLQSPKGRKNVEELTKKAATL